MKLTEKLDSHWQLREYESKGLKLRYALYSQDEIKDYLFFFPGRGEFLEKFNDLPKKLDLSANTALVIIDHRGQGNSDGHPFHIESYDEYCEDIQALIDHLSAKKYSFFACSMGGLISLYGIQKEYFSPKRAFLVSPLISLPKKASWFISRYMLLTSLYHLGYGKKRLRKYNFGDDFDKNLLTKNKEHFKALKNTPYQPQDGTVAWIRATFRAIFEINRPKNIEKSPNNLTICLALHEMVVCNQAVYQWVRKHQELKEKSFIDLYFFKTKHEILFDKPEESDRLFSIWRDTKHLP